MATYDKESDSDSVTSEMECPLCLEIFQSPKILPCFHTFCEECLHKLVSRDSGAQFSCPTCREEIKVPEEGVSKFKTNFYLQPETLSRARQNRIVCVNHPTKVTDLYCLTCDFPICMTCFATTHKDHKNTDMSEAREKLKSELNKGKIRLYEIQEDVEKDISETKEERQAIEEKRAALKEMILHRHAVLQAAIEKYRDEALVSVDYVTDNMLSTQNAVIASLTDLLESITKLQQRVDDAMKSDSMTELQSATREMKSTCRSDNTKQKVSIVSPNQTVSFEAELPSGLDLSKLSKLFSRGSGSSKLPAFPASSGSTEASELSSESALTKPMLSTEMKEQLSRPVLHYVSTTDVMMQSLRAYMGRVVELSMSKSAPEVTMEKHFFCGEGPESDIYHLCPTNDDKVIVSFEPYMLRDGPVIRVYTTDGDPALRADPAVRRGPPLVLNQWNPTASSSERDKLDVSARVTHARRQNGRISSSTPQAGSPFIFAKRCDKEFSKTFFLQAEFSGSVKVIANVVLSEDPFVTDDVYVRTVDCIAPRAFDVDGCEQMFVVLEEALAPDLQRKVLLYRNDERKSARAYFPPVPSFQPSDVCFYTLGGEEFLLVADETNDIIHVVNKSLTLLRTLAPGCPLLVQPTALNTDTKGNLWVGCTGGRVLVFKPVLSKPAEFSEPCSFSKSV